ncbi:MAG: threonylcarbamoyl-AMP synthase, partial [Planctomycetes bacterium]|nr:threonylcarbamoyl-AMP synthase [Planctomycetota bacterium]
MTAKLVVLNKANPDMNVIMKVANALRDGKLVVLPTETVYGIAANYDNSETMQRLRKLKERDENSPFTLHLHDFEQVNNYIEHIPDIACKLAEKYWPGPLTLVFPKIGNQGLGFRVVDSRITQQILRLAQVPIVATSANLNKQTPTLSGLEAMEKIGEYVDIVIESGYAQLQEASSVIIVGDQTYKIVRDSIIG